MDAQQRLYLHLLRRLAAEQIKLATPTRTTVVLQGGDGPHRPVADDDGSIRPTPTTA